MAVDRLNVQAFVGRLQPRQDACGNEQRNEQNAERVG